MKAHMTRRYWFAASHRLHSPQMSDAENRATYGKCNNPHGHGHNYFLEVTVAGQVEAATGMICNLADLDAFVRSNVIERFNLMDLNHDAAFHELVPTTENLCVTIFDVIKQGFRHAEVEKVRIEETMLNSFEYAGGAEPRQ